MRLSPCVLILICAAAAAAADQPTTASPATIPDATIPASRCVQPDLSNVSNAAAEELKSIETRIKSYGNCMQKYIDDRHAKSALYVNLQKAEVDAGNAAAKSLNGFFAQVRQLQNKQPPQPAPKSTAQ
jgi:hypothetical protein